MQLIGLLDGQKYKLIQGDSAINVQGIANDSRKVVEGGVFVAVKGFEQDGHLYIGQSIEKGAIAIVLESLDTYEGDIPSHITVIQVQNGRKTLAAMATHYYNQPSRQFKLVGVTGTNGKTSTVYLINNVLEHIHHRTGLIGTISNKIDKLVMEAERTTPESIELKKMFQDMAEANVNDVIMEVSSHALDLYRVAYSKFDVGVFTNLTLDHLDYHKTMENYREAKSKLFRMCKTAVINIDDEAGLYMMDTSACERYYTYSTMDASATLYASNIQNKLVGVTYDVTFENVTYAVSMETPGRFSVYNGLAAMGACLALGVNIKSIIEAFESKSLIKGRFQAIPSSKGYTAIVDYAHAPDGLENVLLAMKGFAKNKIITVFGCGGDRDKSKRPIMGGIAGKYSNYCIITSDNPRTEDPEVILDEIEAGIKETECTYQRITDRKEAIIKGLQMASEGDLILVAGKGHEDYQIIGKTKHHFDDEEIIKEFMKEQ